MQKGTTVTGQPHPLTKLHAEDTARKCILLQSRPCDHGSIDIMPVSLTP